MASDYEVQGSRKAMFDSIAEFFKGLTELVKVGTDALKEQVAAQRGK